MSLSFRECCFRTLPKVGKKVVWEITHKCDFKCPYCFQTKKRYDNPMRVLNVNDIKVVTTKFKELSVKDVLITGGEIYHATDVLDLISSELNSLEIPFSYSTNFIHDNNFIDLLISSKPRAINISFDPKKNKSIKCEEKTKQIKYVVDQCYLNNIEIKITTVVTQTTINQLQDHLLILSSLINQHCKIKSIYITNPYEIGFRTPNTRPSYESFQDFFKKMSVPPQLNKIIRFVNFHRFNENLQKCPAGNHLLHIEPNGDMYPCHLFANIHKDTFLLGNIVNDPAHELNNKLTTFGLQTAIAIKEYKENNSSCEVCEFLSSCGGGCMAEIVSVGQLIEPQLICKKIEPTCVIPKYIPLKHRQPFLPFMDLLDLDKTKEAVIAEHIRQNLLKTQDLSHGYDHVRSVVGLARLIAKKEKANLKIVTTAAYFHDYEPRRKLIYESHTKLSATKATLFLKKIGFSESELDAIYNSIDSSSYGSEELGHHPLSIEARCVRDADWLDAIGARGIARVFAFAATHGCQELGEVEWDINDPPRKLMSRIGPDPSPIYHFFSKLLWVKDRMQTSTGRLLAEKRHERLVRFLKDYKEEMMQIEDD